MQLRRTVPYGSESTAAECCPDLGEVDGAAGGADVEVGAVFGEVYPEREPGAMEGQLIPGQTLRKRVSKAPIGRLQRSVRHSSASLGHRLRLPQPVGAVVRMLGGLAQQLFHTRAGGVQVQGDAGERIGGPRGAGAGALSALHRLGQPLAGITQLVTARDFISSAKPT
jgi:hypothetical protein